MWHSGMCATDWYSPCDVTEEMKGEDVTTVIITTDTNMCVSGGGDDNDKKLLSLPLYLLVAAECYSTRSNVAIHTGKFYVHLLSLV